MGLDMMLFARKRINGMRDKDIIKLTEIAYWRKANQIHNWFCKNCARQNQEDYDNILVTKQDLEELLETCVAVLKNSKLVKGKVKNGEKLVNGEWETIFEDGLVIEDDTFAKEYLPTVNGFFFGSTGYDEYYIDNIKETIKQLEKILNNDNFDWDNNVVYYYASY